MNLSEYKYLKQLNCLQNVHTKHTQVVKLSDLTQLCTPACLIACTSAIVLHAVLCVQVLHAFQLLIW